MGVGVSIFLMAVGAILTFAIDTNSTDGINVDMIGVILMIVGALGVLLFLTVLGSMNSRRDGGGGDTTVVRERRV
ncbi:MAG: DUF6458 family protein [Acidimicrobiales bacterium]|nr:DUF6458 family protein [Acidimicrobiales bacterium]